MDLDKINMDLVESLLEWIVEGKHNYPPGKKTTLTAKQSNSGGRAGHMPTGRLAVLLQSACRISLGKTNSMLLSDECMCEC